MLKTILSISGKPGLFKLVSHGKNMLIVESLADKKRVPAYAKDKNYVAHINNRKKQLCPFPETDQQKIK